MSRREKTFFMRAALVAGLFTILPTIVVATSGAEKMQSPLPTVQKDAGGMAGDPNEIRSRGGFRDLIGPYATPEAEGQQPSSEGVQERSVLRALPEQLSSGLPQLTAVVGEVAFQIVRKGYYYITAVNGGTVDPTEGPQLITVARDPGPWERFKIVISNPGQFYDKTFQTLHGNFVSSGLGLTYITRTGILPGPDERFHLTDLSTVYPTFYAIQTPRITFLTAMDGGGRYVEAISSQAKAIGEQQRFRILQCSEEPVSGREYGILSSDNDLFLKAVRGGGESKSGIYLGPATAFETKFKLIRLADGTYVLQTANGKNYVTALDGGGHVQSYRTGGCGPFSGACLEGYSDLFHTDATQVGAWEKFKIRRTGNRCGYSIQTASGFYVGIYEKDGARYLTTNQSDIGSRWQLVMYGLGSPGP